MIVNISTLQLAVVFKKSFIHELHAENAIQQYLFIMTKNILKSGFASFLRERATINNIKIKNHC